jgi:hypothetical protein
LAFLQPLHQYSVVGTFNPGSALGIIACKKVEALLFCLLHLLKAGISADTKHGVWIAAFWVGGKGSLGHGVNLQ